MVQKFTSGNFETEVLKTDKLVLVDFYADWCGPCKMMAPVVEDMAAEYEGKVVIGKVNIDESMDIAVEYKIMAVPTFVLYKNGEAKEVMSGIQSKKQLAEIIETYL